MKLRVTCVLIGFLSLVLPLTQVTVAQMARETTSALPRLVRFGGTAKDLNGNPMTGVVGITFAFYSEKTGGAPLWLETQNATADSTGHYTVLLGSTKPEGLPAELFTSEQARWVGVQVSGQPEQPRVLLVSAPYALKAGDAETIGGLPPSAFVLAAPVAIGSGSAGSTTATVPPPAATDVTTTGGILNYLPIFSGASTIIDSAVFQTGSGTTAKVGIDTPTPVAQLDVNGAGNIRGTLSLPTTGAATAAVGKNSQPLSLAASAFNSTSSTALNQVFHLQAEPAGNDTTAPTGTLNLLFGEGGTAPSETGLKFSSKGLVIFATGQTFPGTVTSVTAGAGLAGGTITKTGTISLAAGGVTNADLSHSSLTVAAGTDLTGGGLVSLGSSVTLNLNTAKVPQLAAANTFTNTNTVTVANSNPALTLTNATGDGLHITGGSSGNGIVVQAAGSDGIFVNSTNADGIAATAPVYGGNFRGGSAGVYAENDTDASFSVATYASEFGSTKETVGVYAYSESPIGIGVYGQSVRPSATGAATDSGSYPMGLWGDSGQQFGIGVFGSADQGWAFVGYNNSSSGESTAFLENQETTSNSQDVLYTYGSGFGGTCTIDVSGNVTCSGTVSAVAPVEGGSKKVALNAIHSPENWFEDAGSGQLSSGEAVVNIESVFGETVNTGEEYHVFLTPNGDCRGLYVEQKSATSFVVKELGGGTSSIAFDYRIMAKRKGFEQFRLVDKTEALSLKHRPVKPAGIAGKQMPTAQDVRKQAQKNARPRSVAQNIVPAVNKKQ